MYNNSNISNKIVTKDSERHIRHKIIRNEQTLKSLPLGYHETLHLSDNNGRRSTVTCPKPLCRRRIPVCWTSRTGYWLDQVIAAGIKCAYVYIASEAVFNLCRFCGVTVSTLDFESSDPSSNLGRTFDFCSLSHLSSLLKIITPKVILNGIKLLSGRKTEGIVYYIIEYYKFAAYGFRTTDWREIAICSFRFQREPSGHSSALCQYPDGDVQRRRNHRRHDLSHRHRDADEARSELTFI